MNKYLFEVNFMGEEEATSRKFSLANGTILIDDLNRWWNL
jgi:hypothetical protein